MKRVLGVNTGASVYLPQEIVDYIIDYVSEDRRTLFSCTHLSRTWCIAARVHLHQTLKVSAPTEFESVKELQSMGTINLVRRIVVARQMLDTDCFVPKMMMRLNAFTYLQELDIRYLNIGELLTWLPRHCDALKSTVRTLTLRYPRANAKQLLCFISLFSCLENLAVDSIESQYSPDSVVPVMESSPPLTGRLTLTGIFDQEFMSGLASLQKGLRFRTVDLQFCGEVQDVIDGCAGTIRRFICHPSDFRGKSNLLQISWPQILTFMADIKGLDLSQCESLHHIEVNFNPLIRALPDRPFHNFISAIPSQLETCLIMSYDNDLDELESALLVAPKRKSKSTTPQEEEDERTKRNVKITFGLDIEKEEADRRHDTLKAALARAIGNGVFEFLKSTPVLEVYPRVWNPTA